MESGGYVNLVLAFDNYTDINHKLLDTIELLVTHGLQGLKIKFSSNKKGDSWKNIPFDKLIFKEMNILQMHMMEIEFKGLFLEKVGETNVYLNVYKESEYYGFTIRIPYNQLFYEDSTNLVKSIDQHMQKKCEKICEILMPEYLIVGLEAELEISPSDFADYISNGFIHSIVFSREKEKFVVHEGAYYLDGISLRKNNE